MRPRSPRRRVQTRSAHRLARPAREMGLDHVDRSEGRADRGRAPAPVPARRPGDDEHELIVPARQGQQLVLDAALTVQVLRLEHQIQSEQRRDLMTVQLPRVVLGQRVARGLVAFPMRYGVAASVVLLLLHGLGIHGATASTLCGIGVGALIGCALLTDHQKRRGRREERG